MPLPPWPKELLDLLVTLGFGPDVMIDDSHVMHHRAMRQTVAFRLVPRQALRWAVTYPAPEEGRYYTLTYDTWQELADSLAG